MKGVIFMTKEEILSKSRQENGERDLYAMTVERNAGRVGVIVLYVIVVILTIIHVITTGKLNFMLWIIALSVDTSMDIYKAVKLKSKKIMLSAIGLLIADIAMTVIFFSELYKV